MFVKAIPPKMLHEEFGVYLGNWMPEMDRCWMDYDRGYTVCSRMVPTKQWGNVEHVTITKIRESEDESIIATGGERAIGWNEKMQIKNELFGEDRFAIEVYPKQDRLVDVADVYHLWVFNKKFEMPFGIHPKEFHKAANRGYNITKDDMKILQQEMDKRDIY